MHRERTDIILHSRTIFENIDFCVLIVVQIIDFASKTCVGFLAVNFRWRFFSGECSVVRMYAAERLAADQAHIYSLILYSVAGECFACCFFDSGSS